MNAQVEEILVRYYGRTVVDFVMSQGTTIRILTKRETYAKVSPVIYEYRVEFSRMEVQPAGLFVLAERTLYLRDVSELTVVHEFAHALDLALGHGGGLYYTSLSREIRDAYNAPTDHFLNDYASTDIHEYFAESVRAYVDCPNPQGHFWKEHSNARLREIDPTMYRIIDSLFAKIKGSKV